MEKLRTEFYLDRIEGGCTFNDLFNHAAKELNGKVGRTVRANKLAIKVGNTVFVADEDSYIFNYEGRLWLKKTQCKLRP